MAFVVFNHIFYFNSTIFHGINHLIAFIFIHPRVIGPLSYK